MTILGLGEAGSRFANDLVGLGLRVSGWDPTARPDIPGLRLARDAHDAVSGSNAVLSVTSARAAVTVAEESVEALDGVELYADLNTTSTETKISVADVIGEAGVAFADVALLAPVPQRGICTPALASGRGAELFAEWFRPLGMAVDVIGPEPGVAAQRKLLRSVFMKGLAASIVESLEGAAALGCEDWLRAEIVAVLEGADATLFDRLVEGSSRHATRRVDEMDAASDMLRALGLEPRIASAATAQLAALAEVEAGRATR